MIQLTTPNGITVNVPETDAEDPSPKFEFGQADAALQYYKDNGYVVFKGLIGAQEADEVRKLWEAEVKPFNGFIYRQATARAEKHVKNENGWIMNPILNLQSVDPSHFPGFRKFATENILTNAKLNSTLRLFCGDTPKVVQSMYFEGNSATWEHQDSYYLDSENVGTMVAAWIAVEDISATAGRFFICPKSHLIDLGEQDAYTNIAENHHVYIQKVVDVIRKERMEIRAPKLNKGDVLLWNSWTIHGSLNSQDVGRSRSSITCHVIPAKDKFLQLQTRKMDLATDTVNSTHMYRPKDQAKLKNRLVLQIEGHFPKQFYWLKAAVIKRLVSAKSR